MNRRRNTNTRFVDRRIGVVFGVLIAIPLSLALVEILLAGRIPESVIVTLELPYLLLVYLPVAIIGAFVFEPLGVSRLLEDVPFAGEFTLLIALFGFYYLLTVFLINLSTLVRDIIQNV